METKQFIEKFRADLDGAEADGRTEFHVNNLRSYLKGMEAEASTSENFLSRDHASRLAHFAAINEANLEMLRTTIEAGKSALQSLVLVNGGAAVALLGVMANLVGKDDGSVLALKLAIPMLLFGIGVLLGTVGFGFRYLSQARYADRETAGDRDEVVGDRFRYASIGMAIVGYVVFTVAIVVAYFAVVSAFKS